MYDNNDIRLKEELPRLILNHIIMKDFENFLCVDFVLKKCRMYLGRSDKVWSEIFSISEIQDIITKRYVRGYCGEDKEQFIKEHTLLNIANIMRGSARYSVDYKFREDDGRVHSIREKYYWLDDEKSLLCVTRMNITDIVETEQKMNEELNKAIKEAKEANKKLEETNKALTKASNAKMEFLSRMSHDIRTPMNAIIGMTALAFDEINNPDTMKDYLTKINTSSHFLLGLVNDILDMEKIERGAMELHKEPYSYSEFLGNMKTMFEPLCINKGLKFELSEDKTFLSIVTDKTRLNQIFFNIISNAIKFTPEGGTVSYRIENLKIHDNIISGDYIVADTGIGISKEFQKRMFTEFARDEKSVSHVQGTGLGLPIARSLVELMGGSISVDSELGKGTVITVHLIFEIAHGQGNYMSTRVVSDDTDYEILKKKRVLLVEDHPLNTEIAKKLLEKKDMIVYCAENGQDAINKFLVSNEGFFDVILMDIRMPVMDGLTAARNIRKMDRRDADSIPIIAMTANAYDADRQESKKAGMNAHLAKPVNAKEMYQTIAKILLGD